MLSLLRRQHVDSEEYPPAIPFIIEIKTTTANEIFYWPCRESEVECVVEWGDGSFNVIDDAWSYDWFHTYATPGTYQVSVYGKCGAPKFASYEDPLLCPEKPVFYRGMREDYAESYSQYGADYYHDSYQRENLNEKQLAREAYLQTLYGRSPTQYVWHDFQITDVIQWGYLQGATDWSCAFWSIDFYKMSASDAFGYGVTDMSFMFGFCYRIWKEDTHPDFLRNWDTSLVETMEGMFYVAGDMFWYEKENSNLRHLANWDVSNLKNMAGMFTECPGSGAMKHVESWDVSKVTDLSWTFAHTEDPMGADLSGWDVSNVEYMVGTFRGVFSDEVIEAFDPNIGNWNTSKVKSMAWMFSYGYFNGNINSWDVSKVQNMYCMFSSTWVFNSPLTDWNTGNVRIMESMFDFCYEYNQFMNNWDVSNVISMRFMFSYATSFNQSLSYWNVSNVTNMEGMFSGAFNYNQSMRFWNVSKVTNFYRMFYKCSRLNQPVFSPENSVKINNMKEMFYGCFYFDQSLAHWDVSNVTSMEGAFQYCTRFNGSVANWDTSKVISFKNMFAHASSYEADLRLTLYGAPSEPPLDEDGNPILVDFHKDGYLGFNQSIDHFSFASATTLEGMFWYNEAFNQDLNLTLPPSVKSIASLLSYARSFNSNININTENVENFSFMLNYARSFNRPISLNTNSATNMRNMFSGCYEDIADYGRSGQSTPTNLNYYHSVARISTGGGYVQQTAKGYYEHWGLTIPNPLPENWETVLSQHNRSKYGFNSTLNFSSTANVLDFSSMFSSCEVFNQNLNNWNVSSGQQFTYMFGYCKAFDQPLNNWNTGNALGFSRMFENCSVFNQPLNNWNTSKVTMMNSMFTGAVLFDQPLNNWDTSKVTTFDRMFQGASKFNQNINSWDVSQVTSFYAMFNVALEYNQPMNNWTLSQVKNNLTLDAMFERAVKFNQDIKNWDVRKVTSFSYMVSGSWNNPHAFNQNLSCWNVQHITNSPIYFNRYGIMPSNFLPKWGQPPNTGC